MKRKIKFLSDCELRMMFLFWSADAPTARSVAEEALEEVGWETGLAGAVLDSLVEKGLISRHSLGHGGAQKEFFMVLVNERDYWRNTGCAEPEPPRVFFRSLFRPAADMAQKIPGPSHL